MGSNVSTNNRDKNIDIVNANSDSEVGTLNWDDIKNEIKNAPSLKDESNIGIKIEDDDQDGGSSPFISTELYNKIMEGGDGENTSSPFITTEEFKKIMKGGDIFDELEEEEKDEDDDEYDEDDEEESSDDELMAELSQITLTEEDLMERKPKKFEGKQFPKKKFHKKQYNFSETSSEFKGKNYVGGDSDTSIYKIDSDSVNTSDVNVVSVDSVNGRRFL